MKKLIFSKLIKLILIIVLVFSFVACGGGGSSGGGDDGDYYEPEVIQAPAPVLQTDSDGSVQITAPRYNGLPVTLHSEGGTATGSRLSLQRDQQVAFTVQEDDYTTYVWSLDARGVTPGTLHNNGRTCTFTPEAVGVYNLLVKVTKDGLRGSLSVELVVSE